MHLREARLELRGPDEVRALELAPQPALVHPQQKLLAGALVELVAIRARAELGAQGDELLVLGRPGDEHLAKPPMERVVEVLRRQRGELGNERRMADDRRE